MSEPITTIVRFEKINHNAESRWLELTKRLEENSKDESSSSEGIPMGNILFESNEDSKPDVLDYDWSFKNLGASWAFVNHFDEEGLNIESKNEPPLKGIRWLISELTKYDSKILTTIEFEDFWKGNLGSISLIAQEGCKTFIDETFTDEEWIELVEETYDLELMDKWDSSSCEWEDEESEDIWNDKMFEAIGDFRKEEFNKFTSLSESEKEEKYFRFYK